jgi:hypothetical protein
LAVFYITHRKGDYYMKTIKRIGFAVLVTAIVFGMAVGFAACPNEAKEVSVTKVTLDQTAISLAVGEMKTLAATVEPDKATNKAVNWSSSDTGKVTVDESGKVTALALGEATITVAADGGKTATCTVTVTLVPDSIAFTETEASLVKTYGDAPFTNPINREAHSGTGTITYTSENETVATIAVDEESGEVVVTILKSGTTVITAHKAADVKYAAASHSYTLTVNPKPLTVDGLTAADKVYDRTTDVTISGTPELVGVINDDDVTIDDSEVAFADKNAGENKPIIGFTLGGDDADNYTLPASSVTANITKLGGVTITGLGAADKQYDGTTTATPTGGTINGLISGDTATIVPGTATFNSAAVGAGKTVTFSGFSLGGADGGNYSLSAQPANATARVYAIVTFNPSGGNWDGSTANQTKESAGEAVSAPEEPTPPKFHTFEGWYTQQTGGTVYDFATSITENITLYARLTFLLTSVADVTEYLGTVPANTADTPAPLPIRFHLGDMPMPGSVWQSLLTAIAGADKFVDLDLSRCTMDGTVFNPGSSVATGKDKIVSIALPNTAESIPDATGVLYAAFNNFTVLKSFSGTGLKTIGNYAFNERRSLTSVTISDSVTSIGNNAFSSTGLTSVTIPDGVMSIGNSAFSLCSGLTSITIPKSVTSLGQNAFANCGGLISVTMPEDSNLGSIGYSAFNGCAKLTSITIPKSVTTIGQYAFAYCTGLTSVTFAEGINITSFGNSAFPGGPVGAGDDTLRTTYQNATTGGAGTYEKTVGGSVWTKK